MVYGEEGLIMDLNILISTIIAATAALVAIIGGFLVSRVISLSSERVGIDRRLREIVNDISAKRDMLTRVKESLFEEDADDFIIDNHEKLLLEDKSLEQLIDEDDHSTLTVKELEPYVETFYEIKEEVLSFISNYKSHTVPSDFNELIRGSSELKKPNRKDWYELIYDVMYDQLPEESNHPFGFNLPSFKPINSPPVMNVVSQQKYRDKENERDKLQDELHILDMQKEEQIKILNDYGKPKGLWSGLAVLIYACIVGIGYPSTLLPYPMNYYNDMLTKWFLLILFFSELFALFIYLAFNLHKLTKKTQK